MLNFLRRGGSNETGQDDSTTRHVVPEYPATPAVMKILRLGLYRLARRLCVEKRPEMKSNVISWRNSVRLPGNDWSKR